MCQKRSHQIHSSCYIRSWKFQLETLNFWVETLNFEVETLNLEPSKEPNNVHWIMFSRQCLANMFSRRFLSLCFLTWVQIFLFHPLKLQVKSLKVQNSELELFHFPKVIFWLANASWFLNSTCCRCGLFTVKLLSMLHDFNDLLACEVGEGKPTHWESKNSWTRQICWLSIHYQWIQRT